jgi:predicted P-loop ATPase
MFGCDAYQQIVRDAIAELREIETVNDRRTKTISNEKLMMALAETKKVSESLFETMLTDIKHEFPGGSGSPIKSIREIVDGIIRQEIKADISKFSAVPFSELEATKNGHVLPTLSNIVKVLREAHRVKFVHDSMSANNFLSAIDWKQIEAPFNLPILGSDEVETFHRYNDTANRGQLMIALADKHGPFRTEINFSQLNTAVDIVAKENKVDFYQRWMDTARPHRNKNVDHLSGQNCFAVKYLGAKDEEWSYIWARIFMLALVERCYRPGSPLRHYAIIEGEEEIGKTWFCRSLVPDQWYVSVNLAQAQHEITEFYRSTFDKPVVELPERGGLDRKSDESWKQIVTEKDARFRRMRADDTIDYPKRGIYIVTTNNYKYLVGDAETRPLPLKSLIALGGKMDILGFQKIYPELLAQAIELYESGARPELNGQKERLLQKEQTTERKTIDDSFEYQVINDYLELNMEESKSMGIYLDLIYTFMVDAYGINRINAMTHSRKLGIVLKEFGFESVGVKHVPGSRQKKARMWYYKEK